MSESATDEGRGPFAFVGIAALVSILWLPACQTDTSRRKPAQDPPSLFERTSSCDTTTQSGKRALRAERQGRLHAERYPYDPRDGIRAVIRFQQAYSCYRAAGLNADADRALGLSTGLIARINVDYASSRLALDDALAKEKWSVAAEEVRRLLRLTGHLGRHAYVEALSRLAGKVSTRVEPRPVARGAHHSVAERALPGRS